MKYRIRKRVFLTAPTAFLAEYRLFGIWMKMKSNGTGAFMASSTVYCNTIEEAEKRVADFKISMQRSSDTVHGTSTSLMFNDEELEGIEDKYYNLIEPK